MPLFDVRRAVMVVLAALVLLWPAAINGGVFFSTDSIGYIRGVDQVVGKLFGDRAKTVWSALPMGLGFSVASGAASAPPPAKSPPMAGRSVYYGALVNLGARTGGFWLSVVIQCLMGAFSLHLLARAFGWRREASYALLVGAAAFLTPLPFILDGLMPDALTPVLALVAAAVVAGGKRLSRWEWGCAFALLAFAGMAHTTHMILLFGLVLVALLIAATGVGRTTRAAPMKGAGLLGLALMAGLLSGMAFNVAVQKAYGAPPVQPPFLTARLIGDGRPGEGFIRRHCPQAGFAVCQFKDRLPMETDDFLWGASPPHAAFWTADPMTRVALGNEQFKFAAAVFAENPLGVARQVITDGWTQARDMSLFEVNHKDNVRAAMQVWMVGPDAVQWRASMAYRKAWPTALLDIVEEAMVLTAALALAALAFRTRAGVQADAASSAILIAGLVVLAALLGNALICGGLSGIFGRYQARITAPFILVGLAALTQLRRGRPGSGPSAPGA